MSMGGPFQGSLFAHDFLSGSISSMPDWDAISEADLDAAFHAISQVFSAFPVDSTPNESQTEDDLIWPILDQLGWTATLRQQNLSSRGREDVPDGLLFADDAAKAQANEYPDEWRRYGFGLALVESKRWMRPLDRRSGRSGEETAPSTQMLRYLRRVDDMTSGDLRWGILTNGARWRLYYAGARSVSEQFLDIDLAAIMDVPEQNEGLFALSEAERRHALKVFLTVFGCRAFSPSATDQRTFHQRALDEGRFYEQRVADNLSNLVFTRVFPDLAGAISVSAPDADLQEVRAAALILLYRLLFILYAEDRDLLPVRDERYDDYGLRQKVRGDVGERKDRNDVFSATAARYWAVLDDLSRAIDEGDPSIGLPPYNGGLFNREMTPLLANIRLGDQVMADVIDALSFEITPNGRNYINYRDLSVQQLGSIYERLLEHELISGPDGLIVQPNIFARKGSGSYYTPDDLVGLILKETLAPLVAAKQQAFLDEAERLTADKKMSIEVKRARLVKKDPAELLLNLKICDPAMGSGHFLVSLVDFLADEVIAAMADAELAVEWMDYVSPLTERIDRIRNTILGNAADQNWTVSPEQLDDRHIIRRMVLKRCVYGVDKNTMAVELAKVALWLHTFTVGAPLSFLDHHLRCGDSLFGTWVRAGMDKATAYGSPLLLHGPMRSALTAATSMTLIEGLTDVEIAEAHRSAILFDEVTVVTAQLRAFLSLIHALDWLNLKDRDDKAALRAYFDGQYGDPVQIALGVIEPIATRQDGQRFAEILEQARLLIKEEAFLHWQVTFPGIWSGWESEELTGGFDAVIGNPPWDRIKLQQVEWFAARRREIAMAQRASDRKKMISALERDHDPLAQDFTKANDRAEATARIARTGGNYPLLSGGDINLYSLFVERAMTLVKPDGVIGLLVPSGIASDKTAAPFFKSVATEGRLKALYDFENKKVFFPDVHASFKFCIFVASRTPTEHPAKCAFYLHSTTEIDDPNRCFPLSAQDFARVNPNTGTAPIFRSRRDADLTTAIYDRLPVLVDRSGDQVKRTWPVKYVRMFDMTNDSGLFRTRAELENTEGAYPIGNNRFQSAEGEWVPLYEGKMVQAFDHRAASVVVNAANQHRPASPYPSTEEQLKDTSYLALPQFWIKYSELDLGKDSWLLSYKMITATTNSRTIIASALPVVGVGNSMGVLLKSQINKKESEKFELLLANINAVPFDFIIRQKIQGQNINWYMVEQLPVVFPDSYEQTIFGPKTAAEIIQPPVLELTYTAHDMAGFARDMGYVDDAGEVKPPFIWDEARRLRLRAKLDAVFFHLYGVTDRDDVRYIYSTFPIVEREEIAEYGRYLSRDLCLAYMNALAAGHPDAEPDI